jgi:hypothetical protein
MDLRPNEQQPTLAANSLAPIRPAYATERFRLLLVFPPETSSDRRAENTDSDAARSGDRSACGASFGAPRVLVSRPS